MTKNSPTIIKPPRFSNASSSTSALSGRPLVTAKFIIRAGTKKLTSDGINKFRNSPNSRIPFCHTINVVMSPNGLKAPPALAATTMLMQARLTNLGLPLPTARTTAHIINAVVRLSAIGDIKKAKRPVIQNRAL